MELEAKVGNLKGDDGGDDPKDDKKDDDAASASAASAAASGTEADEKDDKEEDASHASQHARILPLVPWQHGGKRDKAIVLTGSRKVPAKEWSFIINEETRQLELLDPTGLALDLAMANLFTTDAVFFLSSGLIEATARLYASMGSGSERSTSQVKETVAKLFQMGSPDQSSSDPTKVSCGFTRALIPEPAKGSLDGREDFEKIWPHLPRLPVFFTSHASTNLRYVTPEERRVNEANRGRAGGGGDREGDGKEGGSAERKTLGKPRGAPAPPKSLPQDPAWSLSTGRFEEEHQKALRAYRERNPVSLVVVDGCLKMYHEAQKGEMPCDIDRVLKPTQQISAAFHGDKSGRSTGRAKSSRRLNVEAARKE